MAIAKNSPPFLTEGEHIRMFHEQTVAALSGPLSAAMIQAKICDTDPRYTGSNFAEVLALNATEIAEAAMFRIMERFGMEDGDGITYSRLGVPPCSAGRLETPHRRFVVFSDRNAAVSFLVGWFQGNNSLDRKRDIRDIVAWMPDQIEQVEGCAIPNLERHWRQTVLFDVFTERGLAVFDAMKNRIAVPDRPE